MFFFSDTIKIDFLGIDIQTAPVSVQIVSAFKKETYSHLNLTQSPLVHIDELSVGFTIQ